MHDAEVKREILKALRDQLAEEIEAMARLAKDAADAATHPENKPENDKDMRSTEASYVARGQAGRVEELTSALTQLSAMELKPCARVDVSALVELSHKNIKSLYFIVPAAGGRKVRVGGKEVTAITVSTPIGVAIDGLAAGDEAEVETPAGPKVYEIVSVE
jgi:transcription elongation GreA/GreB family factor